MGNPSIQEFHRPDSLERVWELLEAGGPSVRLVGGGTDLAIRCPPEVRTVVDLSRSGLNRIDRSEDGSVRVGAMATLTDMLEHPLTAGHAGGVIAEMLVHVGSPLLRNAATIGGHLARGRLSDVVPVCLALDAEVEVYDGEHARMELETYYEHMAHQRLHVLTEVVFPAPAERTAASFLRFSRSAFDVALVAVACRVDLDAGVVKGARVAVGASFGPASLMHGAEALLDGTRLEDEAIDEAATAVEEAVAVDPTWMAGEDYRRHLAGTLVRRSLADVRRRLGGES